MMQWLTDARRREEIQLSVEEQLELIKKDQEALEKRVALVEDLIAAIRREDVGEVEQ